MNELKQKMATQWVAGLVASMVASVVMAASPSLHIVREGQNISELRVVKLLRSQCVMERNMFHDMHQRQPSTWAIMLQDMQRKRPGYDPERALAPEPDWSKVAVVRDEEYFDGDRYALYREGARYKLVPDGSCDLKAEPGRTADIDDGVHRYVVNITRGQGNKGPSAVVTQAQARGEMQRTLSQNPAVVGALAGFGPGIVDAAAVAKGLLKVVGRDTVMGERCDYLALGADKGTAVCFWSVMHTYPAQVPRSVVLKAKVRFGADENISQAVVFERAAKIDPKVFVPPSGIALRELPVPR
jgi:hypothetical protein